MTSEGFRYTGVTTRRSLLRGGVMAAGAGAAAFALACGGSSKDSGSSSSSPGAASSPGGAAPAGSTAAGQVKKGGVHTWSQISPFNDVMDPHTSLNQAPWLFSYIGNTAVRHTREGDKLVGELVEKWETPGDGSEFVLKVRPGMKWHDKAPINGRAIDAEDIAYNLNRIYGKLNPNELARFQRRTTLDGLDKAEAVDATTVRVKLDKPSGVFLNGMADFRNQFFPKDFLDKGGKFEDPNTLVGSGPFIMDSWKDGQKAVWKKNPNYWKPDRPHVDTVQWVWITDQLSQLAALAKGDIDMFYLPTKAHRDVIKKTVPDAQEERWVFANWNHLRFNATKKPLDDPRVRRAIFLSLKYKDMADAFYGDGYYDFTGPTPSAFPDGYQAEDLAKMPGYNPATKDADIKTAKELMTAAGYPDGAISFKILQASAVTTSANYDYSIRATDQLKSIWPAMKPEIELPPDGATFSRRQVQGDFDVIAYVNYAYPHAVIELTAQWHSTGGRNYGKFKDAKVDSMLDGAFRELDAKKRTTLLRDLQDHLLKEAMPAIGVSQPRMVTVSRGRIKGMKDFGGRVEGGVYDYARHTENMWIG